LDFIWTLAKDLATILTRFKTILFSVFFLIKGQKDNVKLRHSGDKVQKAESSLQHTPTRIANMATTGISNGDHDPYEAYEDPEKTPDVGQSSP
jgi:hypothetical protein